MSFLIALALVLILAVIPWVYTLTKENTRLREKYRLCSEERNQLNIKLAEAGNEASALSRAIRNIVEEYPSRAEKRASWQGPNMGLVAIRERLQEDVAARDSLYQYEHLAVTEAPKLGNDRKDTAWALMNWIVADAHRLNIEMQKKPSRGQRLQADIESLLAALKEHEDQYPAGNYTANGGSLMRLPELSAMVTDQLKGVGDVTSRFLVKYGRDGEYCKPFVTLANYICCLSSEWEDCRKSLDKCKSNLETSKNLANCYLLSRNQARDDIQSALIVLVGAGAITSQEQLDAVLAGRGVPAPNDASDAKTFEDFKRLVKTHKLAAQVAITQAPVPPKGAAVDPRLEAEQRNRTPQPTIPRGSKRSPRGRK